MSTSLSKQASADDATSASSGFSQSSAHPGIASPLSAALWGSSVCCCCHSTKYKQQPSLTCRPSAAHNTAVPLSVVAMILPHHGAWPRLAPATGSSCCWPVL